VSERVAREGRPTIRVRTLDQDGNVTGEIILGPVEARTIALNLENAVENLGMIIDATGGIHHGGAARMGVEEGGEIEIVWTESGNFDDLDLG
jgi:hypothetical protein